VLHVTRSEMPGVWLPYCSRPGIEQVA